MNIPELVLLMKELGQPAYRADQIFEWLHTRFVNTAGEAFSFAGMNNLPASLRDELEKRCYITPVNVEKELHAKDGTVKFLLGIVGGRLCPSLRGAKRRSNLESTVNARLFDCDTGAHHLNIDEIETLTQPDDSFQKVYIESVLMTYAHGRSVCISTQAGCRMGCVFCATGESGLIRNLSAGEMCMQVYAATKYDSLMEPSGISRVRNVVLMGCGEPLDNFEATLRFIELITHPKGAGLSQRHITLSTCGLVPEILALAKHRMQITLAISLHSADDATRQALMPIAKTYPIKELIAACKEYANITRRRISFEYALSKGINDSATHARALVKLLKGLLCHVNLIPVNPAASHNLTPTNKREAAAFAAILQHANIPVTIRRTIGAEVNAACGQLRAQHANTTQPR